MATKPESTKVLTNKSKGYISISAQVKLDTLHGWLTRIIDPKEKLFEKLSISDGESFFPQSDEIVIGEETVYWYMSRVGEYFFRSDDSLDAKHKGINYKISYAEVQAWKAVVFQDLGYLELQTMDGRVLRSVGIGLESFDTLVGVQLNLNNTTGCKSDEATISC